MREKYFVKWKRNTLSNLSQPSARRAHRHPPTVIYPPNVGRKYPIQIYLFNWHICKIFVCLLRKMMVPNCPFYTAVPNCPWCQIVPFSLRCQIVPFSWRCQIVPFSLRCQIVLGAKLSSFTLLVPNCPGAKLSSVPNCPRCQIVLGAKLSPNHLNEEASVRVNILGAIRCGEGDNNSARRRHMEKLPSCLTAE